MEFKVGQKYRIVDASKMWDAEKYNSAGNELVDGEVSEFSNMEIVTVVKCPFGYDDLCLFSDGYSTNLKLLTENVGFRGYNPIEEYLEIYEDDESEQSDDTISIYHIADVLEDALFENEKPSIIYEQQELKDKIKLCIKSLRKAGY